MTVYDAQTLGLLQGPVSLPSHPHAVALSPDGRLAVIAGKFQVVGLKLPSLDRAFEAKPVAIDIPFTFSRHVLLDKEGENYYLSGDTENVVRMTPAGDIVAGFEAPGVEGIALSRDGETLFALTEFGRQLTFLRTPNLELDQAIELPFAGAVIIPLEIHDRLIIVGSAGGQRTTGRTPLVAASIDLAAGSVLSLQELGPPGMADGGRFLFGDGNQWVEVGDFTAVVPTQVGMVVINTETGSVSLYSAADLQSSASPCCDVATYPDRSRIVVADFLDFVQGRLVVYRVDESFVHEE